MTRRADRRRYAIIGVLAEQRRASALELGLLLHRAAAAVYLDLEVLENDGRVVGEWANPKTEAKGRMRVWRLPTDEERHAHQRRIQSWEQATKTAPVRLIPKTADGCT